MSRDSRPVSPAQFKVDVSEFNALALRYVADAVLALRKLARISRTPLRHIQTHSRYAEDADFIHGAGFITGEESLHLSGRVHSGVGAECARWLPAPSGGGPESHGTNRHYSLRVGSRH